MNIILSLPIEFAALLGRDDAEREQRARESIALELYREGRISLRRMGALAGLGDDYWAADALRVRHRMPVVSEDPELDDSAAMRSLLQA